MTSYHLKWNIVGKVVRNLFFFHLLKDRDPYLKALDNASANAVVFKLNLCQCAKFLPKMYLQKQFDLCGISNLAYSLPHPSLEK